MKKISFLIIISILLINTSLLAENMPLVEIPTTYEGDTFVVFISGDGGWRKIDKVISNYFIYHGVSVVGINSFKYFWKKRYPDEVTEDVNRVIDTYKKKFNRKRVIILGYSFGADIVPFILS